MRHLPSWRSALVTGCAWVTVTTLGRIVGCLRVWLVLRQGRSPAASHWLPASVLGWLMAGTLSLYGGAGVFAIGQAALLGATGWLIAALMAPRPARPLAPRSAG